MTFARRLVTVLGTGFTVAALSLSISTAASADQGGIRKIRMLDDCDPATFNAAIGPGTCVGKGDTTFTEFITELAATKRVEDWEFKPDEKKVKAGQTVVAQNRGGEAHSFTCVKQFGPGIVPQINQL